MPTSPSPSIYDHLCWHWLWVRGCLSTRRFMIIPWQSGLQFVSQIFWGSLWCCHSTFRDQLIDGTLLDVSFPSVSMMRVDLETQSHHAWTKNGHLVAQRLFSFGLFLNLSSPCTRRYWWHSLSTELRNLPIMPRQHTRYTTFISIHPFSATTKILFVHTLIWNYHGAEYMLNKLHIEESQIPNMCQDLYKEHGTTMAGLKVCASTDTSRFTSTGLDPSFTYAL